MTLEAFDTGWYRGDTGFHDSGNTNYITGLGNPAPEFRSFFAFDLNGVAGNIVDARFDVFSHLVDTTDPFETLALWDVTTPISDLLAGGSGRFDIFDDLATGVQFGSREVLSSESDSLLEVQLNQDALAALNAARGQLFALGGSVSSIDPASPPQILFAFSNGNNSPQQLTLTLAESDFYRISAEGNRMLMIETATPAEGSGEFVNGFDPVVRLYDSDHNLVATNDNGASDRRNARLQYKVPKGKGGTYYIEVAASPLTSNRTSGAYILSVKGNEADPADDNGSALASAAVQKGRGNRDSATTPSNPVVVSLSLSSSLSETSQPEDAALGRIFPALADRQLDDQVDGASDSPDSIDEGDDLEPARSLAGFEEEIPANLDDVFDEQLLEALDGLIT